MEIQFSQVKVPHSNKAIAILYQLTLTPWLKKKLRQNTIHFSGQSFFVLSAYHPLKKARTMALRPKPDFERGLGL